MTGPHAIAHQGWCTFRVSGRDYAVDVASVQEVLRPQPFTRVPGAPPAWTGLVNLRGRIVPVLDLRVLFDAAPAAAPAPAGNPLLTRGAMVVVRAADGPVALGVDAIGDVHRAHGDLPLRPWPAPAGGGERGGPDATLFTGVLATADRLHAVLDLEQVVTRAFERALEPARRAAGDPS